MNKKKTPNTVGRPRNIPSVERNVREQFLDTALVLFSSQGVAATSVAQIAKKINVTPAMAHYYFKNRNKLLQSVAEERIFPLIDRTWSGFSKNKPTGSSFLSKVENLIENLVYLIGENEWLPDLWVGEVLASSGEFRGKILAYLNKRYIPHFEAELEAAQKRGEVNPALDGRLLIVSMLGTTMLPLAIKDISHKKPGNIQHEQVLRHAKAIIRSGLLFHKQQTNHTL